MKLVDHDLGQAMLVGSGLSSSASTCHITMQHGGVIRQQLLHYVPDCQIAQNRRDVYCS